MVSLVNGDIISTQWHHSAVKFVVYPLSLSDTKTSKTLHWFELENELVLNNDSEPWWLNRLAMLFALGGASILKIQQMDIKLRLWMSTL
jgi:hypothetical protein